MGKTVARRVVRQVNRRSKREVGQEQKEVEEAVGGVRQRREGLGKINGIGQ